MTNIAESLKESAAGALSEHGYTGYPNNNPPGLPDDSMPADLLQGKALQSHLTALPLNTVTCRTALAVPTNLYADYTNATNWVEAYNLNLLSWGTIINADLASGNPVPVFTDVIALSTGNIAGWNSAYIR